MPLPKGLKQTSGLITISGSETMRGNIDTYEETRIDLQLNPLDNEVFVVLAVDIMLRPPYCVDATNTVVKAQLSTTQMGGYFGLANPSVFAAEEVWMMTEFGGPSNNENFSGYQLQSQGSPQGEMPYLAIIATNDFYSAIDSENTGQSSANTFSFKVYGFRARADASVYSALVQSELISGSV